MGKQVAHARMACLRILAIVVALVPAAAPAAEDSLCDGLWLLERLPADALLLLQNPSATDVRATYWHDLESATHRFADDMHLALTSRFAAGSVAMLGLHLRFFQLVENGRVDAARALLKSPEWRRAENWFGNEARLRHCAGAPAQKRPGTAQAGATLLTRIADAQDRLQL
jgi:hypothetical protein